MKSLSSKCAPTRAPLSALALALVLLPSGHALSADGDPCDDELACTTDDRLIADRCIGDTYSCDDGLDCTDDVCDGSGGCRHFVVPGHCLIKGACFEHGSSDPNNSCRVCEPSRSTDAWDMSTGRPCLGGVCRDGRCNVVLHVQTQGPGSGVVLGNRMLCDSECDVELAAGTRVHLSAEPARDSQFEGWSGACSGTGDCVLKMSRGARVFASFDRRAPAAPPVQLIVDTEGQGLVTSFPAGVDCGSHCWHTFPHGTTVTLYATPRKGMKFRGWRGGCHGRSRECSLELRVAQMITARFGKSLSSRLKPSAGRERIPGPLESIGSPVDMQDASERKKAADEGFVGPLPRSRPD